MFSKIMWALMSLFVLINISWADIVEVEINPKEPIKNEPFELIFKVETKGSDAPYISFDPGSFEVLGRRSAGSSSMTTILNGRITTKKEHSFVYELQTERSGNQYIKDIVIEADGEKHQFSKFKINVLRAAKRARDMILVAVPSKSKVYVGEGFDINYYYYFNNNTANYDVKKYPQLNGFLKRFRNTTNQVASVEYDGRVYKRLRMYSARLFGEKSGKYKIDPLSVSVDYIESQRGRSSFGIFGRRKSKSLRSKKIEIEVMDLPTKGIPESFSGLVGEHEFKLIMNKNKYLVNEAIEAKLEVTGLGALEKFDAPKLFEHENLEEFDTKSELETLTVIKSKKIFEYTYLARGAFDLKKREFEVSYFDPEEKVYKKKNIEINPLIVSGKAFSGDIETSVSSSTQVIDSAKDEPQKLAIVGPVFYKSVFDKVKNRYIYINYILSMLILITLFYIFKVYFTEGITNGSTETIKIINRLKKEDLGYSDLYQLLGKLSSVNELTINQKIAKSTLSKDAKHYFDHAVLLTERAKFKDNDKAQVKFVSKHFKELVRNLNENN